MASTPNSILLNASLPPADTTTGSNFSGQFPPFMWGNWTVPDDCLMVLFSQLDLILLGNNPDGLASAAQRRIVHKFKNVMLLLLFATGVPANLINMVVFYKQGLKDRVTLCLFFLALTDGLYLVYQIAFQMEEIYMQFISKQEIGPHFTFVINNKMLIFFGIFYASPIFSAIIAVERCLCVFNPLKSKTLIRTRTMALIIFLVYVSVYALSFVIFMRYRVGCLYDPVLGERLDTALEDEFYTENKDLIKVMDGVVLGVGDLGGTVVVVTIATILTIWKLRQINQWRSEAISSFSSRDLALTKMLIRSSILFIVCVCPYALLNFIRIFFPEMDYAQKEHNFFVCFTWVCETILLFKPVSNIFIYYTMGSRYRETLWAVFGRKKQKQVS